jgi:hypothetical protein
MPFPLDWVTGLAAAAAIVTVVPLFWLMFKVNLNAPVFTAQILKLVAANNTDRAVKLASVAPNAPVCRGTKSLLQAYTQGMRDDRGLREAFDTGVAGREGNLGRGSDAVAAAVGKLNWMIYLALALLGGAAFMAYTRDFALTNTQWGIGIVALVLAINALVSSRRIGKRVAAARDKLVAELAR